jgi:5'-nucleotidase
MEKKLLPVECKLRIIAVNDVYKLDNFSRLRTLIQKQSIGFDNVVTTLAGDFLAPSLLSSIDHGRGMVSVMNALPIDMVCFGNHESDIPYESLCQRIHEFDGVWLNSNMEGFQNKSCPKFYVKELNASDGSKEAVAFLGFLIGGGKHTNLYREDAFGGHTIVPILKSAPQAVEMLQALHPELLPNGIIPLTHQDKNEDVELAKTGMFPVIIGGHDHEVIHKNVAILRQNKFTLYESDIKEEKGQKKETSLFAHSCPVVKAGKDAEAAFVIDILWKKSTNCNKYNPPTVTTQLVNVHNFPACPKIQNLVHHTLTPVRELEAATMYELDVANGENYSSVGMRFQPTSMGSFLASAMRKSPRLQCDAVLLNSGAIRAETEYGKYIGGEVKKAITFADLQKECPFDSEMVVVKMPGQVLNDAIALSRKKWKPPAITGLKKATANTLVTEAPEAFQCDDGIQIEVHLQSAENFGCVHTVTHVGGKPIDPTKMYSVGCDRYDIKNNEVLANFAMQYPENVPNVDGARALEILVEYFCAHQWRSILKYYGSGELELDRSPKSKNQHVNFLDLERFFQEFDITESGSIGEDDLERALIMSRKRNERRLSAEIGKTVSGNTSCSSSSGVSPNFVYDNDTNVRNVPSLIVVKQMIRIFDTGHGAVSRKSIKKGLMKAGVYLKGLTPAPKKNQKKSEV